MKHNLKENQGQEIKLTEQLLNYSEVSQNPRRRVRQLHTRNQGCSRLAASAAGDTVHPRNPFPQNKKFIVRLTKF